MLQTDLIRCPKPRRRRDDARQAKRISIGVLRLHGAIRIGREPTKAEGVSYEVPNYSHWCGFAKTAVEYRSFHDGIRYVEETAHVPLCFAVLQQAVHKFAHSS